LQHLTSGADTTVTTATADNIERQKPNYAPTGLLAAETNTVGGIVLKYNEPPDARKPPARDSWRLYVFKGSELLETVHLGERSCWLFGRERMVVDFPTDHPSCSKQHAVIQFRFVEKRNEFGDRDGRVR
jgi:smad nuclear-interacting protein 1